MTLALDRQIHLEVVPVAELGSFVVVAYFGEDRQVGSVALEERRTLVVLFREVGHLVELSWLVKRNWVVAGLEEPMALVVALACPNFEELTALEEDVGLVVVSSPGMGEPFAVVHQVFEYLEQEAAEASVGFALG